MTSPALSATGRWSATGALPTPTTWSGRHDGAVALIGEKVLVAGGTGATGTALAATAILNPAVGTWAATAPMSTARRLHSTTVLPDGRVLVAGGRGGDSAGLAGAELFHPEAGTWTPTGAMHTGRWGHSAALVGDKVLVAGGTAARDGLSMRAMRSAELYDPATGTWTEVAPMTDARSGHPAVVLANGRVLVVGGSVPTGVTTTAALGFCELYDPVAGTWTPTGTLLTRRADPVATAVQSGTGVLVTGDGVTAERYSQASGAWTAVAALPGARSFHRAAALGPSQVLVVGGAEDGMDDAGFPNATIFDVGSGTWLDAGALAVGRWDFTAIALSPTRVLVAGGTVASGLAAADPAVVELTATAETFDVTAGSP